MSARAMDPEDPMIRSGARWCADHGQWECVAKVGREHHGVAIRGQAYCRFHVGKTTELAKAQGEANLLAWRAAGAGEVAALDPGAVVMDQLRVAVMRADIYGEMLRLQFEDQGYDGIVGPTFAAGREGVRIETGESARGLAKLEGEWRDRAVRFAKTAHDMGIDQRQIEIEQGRAQMLVAALLGVFEELGLVGPARDRGLQVFLRGIGRGDTVAGEVAS